MKNVISIVGPTASGKTALSLALAQALDGEIVNLDAYQIYRGMNIGTAKPSAEELAQVKHHLIDIVDIEHDANVAQFQQWARDAIAEINSRGKIAICVGGSGLYVRAVFEEMDFPETDPDVRAKYEELLEEIGPAALHQELARRAPEVAAVIVPGNARRVVRALEVIELTGSYNPQLPDSEPVIDALRIGLAVERPVISDRITRRTELMFEAGWEAETAALVEQGLLETRTARKALGYREVAEVLAGTKSLDAVKLEISQSTYRFSKRQMQWFNRDDLIHWIEFDDAQLVQRVLNLHNA